MINQTAVKKFFDHYHAKVTSNPTLYKNNDTMITVVLPKELLDYSNASSGHSGFGAGARPVGIRRSVSDSRRALADIFATVDSLAKFILSSECDGPAYVAGVKARHLGNQKPVDPMAKDVFWDRYNKDTLASIRDVYGADMVRDAWNSLTISEFENLFAL